MATYEELEARIAKLETQVETLDRILGAVLPPGAKLVPVEGVGDVLYVPFK